MKKDSSHDEQRACRKCGELFGRDFQFCPACGWNQKRAYFKFTLNAKSAAVLLVATAAMWGAVRVIQMGTPLGSEPRLVASNEAGHTPPPTDDPEIVSLRQAAEKSPDQKDGWKTLAAALSARVENAPAGTSGPVLELIDALQQILRIDGKDTDALLGMANASFENRVMDKAAGFYARYLELKPDDMNARARYGSVLSLSGQFEKAQAELAKVLAAEPKNFPAQAYLAISYAQQGQKAKAEEAGARALAIAPSDEARAEFGEFMKRVSEQPATGTESAAPQAASAPAKPAPAGADAQAERAASYVSENPVAGPKYQRYERAGDTVRVFLKDFPMRQMPPFAKQKFLGGIKARAQAEQLSEIAKIEFRDAADGSVLETLDLR